MNIKTIVKSLLKRLPGFRGLAGLLETQTNLIHEINRRLQEQGKQLQEQDKQLQEQCKQLEDLFIWLTNQGDRVFEVQKQIMDYQDAVQFSRNFDGKEDRLAVYTVIMGDYDTLSPPLYVDKNCDYFCITNNRDITSDFYKVIYIDDNDHLGNPRFSRYPKLNPHIFFPEYMHSLYIDANFTILHSLWSWIHTYLKGRDMLSFVHNYRDCIYDEGIVCIELKKDCPKIINQQLERYRKDGFPPHYGLLSGGILYRQHNSPILRAVDEMWWDEIQKGSKRDQLSFNYVCYCLGFQYDTCPLNYFHNPYFAYITHKQI